MTGLSTDAVRSATASVAAVVWAQDDAALELEVVEHRDDLRLICSGELDIVSGHLLDAELRSLEARPVRLAVDLHAIAFADTYGLAPLFESARRRRACGGGRIEITDASRQVGRVLALLRVPQTGPIDVGAWDAAAIRAWPAAN